MIESDIYSLLAETAAGDAATDGNVFSDVLPDSIGTYPAFVFSLGSGEEALCMDGPGGLDRYECVVSIFDTNREALAAAAKSLKDAFHGISRDTLEGYVNAGDLDHLFSAIQVSYGASDYDEDTQVFSQDLYFIIHLTL